MRSRSDSWGYPAAPGRRNTVHILYISGMAYHKKSVEKKVSEAGRDRNVKIQASIKWYRVSFRRRRVGGKCGGQALYPGGIRRITGLGGTGFFICLPPDRQPKPSRGPGQDSGRMGPDVWWFRGWKTPGVGHWLKPYIGSESRIADIMALDQTGASKIPHALWDENYSGRLGRDQAKSFPSLNCDRRMFFRRIQIHMPADSGW